MAERHLWDYDPHGFGGFPCHSQAFGTGCTELATWRHGMEPRPYLTTFWCERHKPMAEG
jgi:hypothetical protein